MKARSLTEFEIGGQQPDRTSYWQGGRGDRMTVVSDQWEGGGRHGTLGAKPINLQDTPPGHEEYLEELDGADEPSQPRLTEEGGRAAEGSRAMTP